MVFVIIIKSKALFTIGMPSMTILIPLYLYYIDKILCDPKFISKKNFNAIENSLIDILRLDKFFPKSQGLGKS